MTAIDASYIRNNTATGAAAPEAKQELGKDAFLKLLVAQLKYQNPMEPTDATQFMSQTAQFSMVEKLEEIAKNTATAQIESRSLTAAGLVGREVSYLNDAGAEVQGTVTAARLGGAGPVLTVDGRTISLADITEVRRQAAS
jgi:flagellar basal-body rod modification protein FlgD